MRIGGRGTVTDRAVRKANRERLLRDFTRAAREVRLLSPALVLAIAARTTSRTRYACLMTAFGQ